MIKTQVQIPDDLLRKAKSIAASREWSLAEVMRRGLEYMAQTHMSETSGPEWELPLIRGGDGLDPERLEEAMRQDREEFLLHRAGSER